MNTPTIVLFVIAAVVGAIFLPSRLGRGRAGSPTAQRAFKQANGARVAQLLAPPTTALVQVRRSPWMDISLGGRHVRMVAAPLRDGTLQAGVELLEWQLGGLEIWHTNGDADELQVPDGVPTSEVTDVVAKLRALDVDSVASPQPGRAHILRVRFDTLEELAAKLDAATPLLQRLEGLVVSVDGDAGSTGELGDEPDRG